MVSQVRLKLQAAARQRASGSPSLPENPIPVERGAYREGCSYTLDLKSFQVDNQTGSS
jgi:hypothetical protein